MLNELLAMLVPLSFVNGLLLLAGVLEIVARHIPPVDKWLDQAMDAAGFCRGEVDDDGQPEK